MQQHIIKYEYRDGEKLKIPETWCGAVAGKWCFLDAQHALLSIEQGSLISPCSKCLEKIILLAEKGVTAA